MYYTAICAIVKDENPYLEEWVEYHLSIGIDYFIIYDNNSVIPVRETLSKYIAKHLLEVIEWKAEGSQSEAYNDCLAKYRTKTFWLAYIDADEFITLKNDSTISKFLARYEVYAGVCLNWLVYNANGNVFKQNTPVIETFTQHIPVEDPLNHHIKTILQPRFTNKVTAHFGKYQRGYFAVNENKIPVMDATCSFSNNQAFIRHYYTKSYEEWVEKLNRGRAATPLPIPKPENHFWLYNADMSHRKQELQKKFLGSILKHLTINDLHLNTRKTWTAVINDDQKSPVNKCLEVISNQLLNDNIIKSLKQGLFNGRAGVALFLFNYCRYTGSELYEDKAIEIFNIDNSNWDHSVINGLAGIGWTMEYLSQNQFIDCDTNAYLNEVDKLFAAFLHRTNDLSLSAGLTSYGIYFLSRMSSLSFSLNYSYNVQNGKANLERIVNRIFYLLSEKKSRGDKRIDNGDVDISLEIFSIMPFLLKIHKLGICLDKSSEIIRQHLDFCQNYMRRILTGEKNNEDSGSKNDLEKLTNANILLQTSIGLNDINLLDETTAIIIELTNNHKLNTDIHTTINSLHIYLRVYNELKLPQVRAKINDCIDHVIELFENADISNIPPGLKNGLAGIGLTLLAATSNEEPLWDRVLLLS